jgi:endonuclease/exonuclease/phosphatase family metal-dependent hydrolase
MPVKLVNWNVEWAEPKWKAAELQLRIAQQAADIVCLTETDTERLALPPGGHYIRAQDNWGQPCQKGREARRKVLLWSREPWEAADDVGRPALPPGRFVSSVTQTGIGEVTVIGICIPYSHSRVGSCWNRKAWQDHEEYLDGLAGLLKQAPRTRLVVVGDFNQRIGQRSSTPLRLRAALQSALGPNLSIATATLGFQGRRTIDHIALSNDLATEPLGVISNVHQDDNLSDHFGVVADLSARGM